MDHNNRGSSRNRGRNPHNRQNTTDQHQIQPTRNKEFVVNNKMIHMGRFCHSSRKVTQILPVSMLALPELLTNFEYDYIESKLKFDKTAFYRSALLLLERKRSNVRPISMFGIGFVEPLLLTDLDVYSTTHIPEVAEFINSYGEFSVDGVNYTCGIPDIGEPNPCSITITNLRKYAEACTVPGPSADIMSKYQAFPFSKWSDGVLDNIDEIIPVDYLTNYKLQRRDMFGVKIALERWSSKLSKVVGSIPFKSTKGHSCALVSEELTSSNFYSVSNKWSHATGVTEEDFKLAGRVHLGAVATELIDNPAYFMRRRENAIFSYFRN